MQFCIHHHHVTWYRSSFFVYSLSEQDSFVMEAYWIQLYYFVLISYKNEFKDSIQERIGGGRGMEMKLCSVKRLEESTLWAPNYWSDRRRPLQRCVIAIWATNRKLNRREGWIPQEILTKPNEFVESVNCVYATLPTSDTASRDASALFQDGCTAPLVVDG